MIETIDVLTSRGWEQERIRRHVERYERTFETMAPWLPKTVTRFLDIGSGTGGIASLIARRYPGCKVHLLDGDAEKEKWTGYRPDGKPWASVSDAARLVLSTADGHEVTPIPDYVAHIPYDYELVYSICSWGHHYPIETYLDLVKRTLLPGGTLIADLRKGEVGEHGREMLGQFLTFVGNVSEGKKYDRLIWRR